MTREIVTRIDKTWDGQAVSETDVAVVRLGLDERSARIDVSAPFHGDPRPAGPAGPTDGLWNHEVVEVFLLGSQRYLEVELGPHGHYLVIQLGAPRVALRRLIPIEYTARTPDAAHWRGTAHIPNVLLPSGLDRFNAYRMYGSGAARRHLAAFPVRGEEPNFHRLECFGPLQAERASGSDTVQR